MATRIRTRGRPIALLTDFGTQDAYVGTMKGVIHSINPTVMILDLCHEVNPQDIIHGQVLLQDNYSYFPRKSIFCCIIDPEVGTDRKCLLIQWQGYSFIGPDNGLLTFILKKSPPPKVFKLPIESGSSNTFHGRDIFAPAAAKLSREDRFIKTLEPVEVEACRTLSIPPLREQGTSLIGEILYWDHFGNLVTNIKREELPQNFSVFYEKEELPLVKTYDEMLPRRLYCILGSSNRLEISAKNASAKPATYLNKSEWQPITVKKL
jgi:S-adenosyl-L-methionine hydrolase (adenosine-forming)